MWNSEHGKNDNGHKGLDWFTPHESETLRLVWGGIMRGRGVPSNGAQRTRASIRGRWTLIGVGYNLGRSSSLIIG
jgi:hypothetical protein